MKLILSSCDFRNERSRQAIIDNLDKPIDRCRLLFIPNEKATYEGIHSEKYYLRMQEFGFDKDNILVFNYYNPERSIGLDIDVIYISGGNTFATLKRIKDCGFDREIVRYVKSGVIYIGGSAGAHIVSQNIEHLSAFDTIPNGINDFNGLGLLDGVLICHYTMERKELYDILISENKYKVYALSDDDSMIINSKTNDVVRHYDLLIEENNDPVHDPKPLRDYMDKWDGQAFIDKMELDKNKFVLEIGVGTGRLAVRVAPLCGEFGLRLEEICTLRVEYLMSALKTGQLVIKGKGGQTRAIDLSAKQRSVITKYLDYARCSGRYPRDYLISASEKGGVQREKRSLQNWMSYNRKYFIVENRADLSEAGKKKRSETVSWHGLRHTYAQRTYENELKSRPRKARKIVSENLGHHRTEVTRIYLADKPQKK